MTAQVVEVWFDWVRVAAIVLAVITAAFNLAIAWSVWKRRMRGEKSPYYLEALGIAFFILIFLAIALMYERMGQGPSGWAPLCMAAMALGVTGYWNMFKHMRDD